MVALIGDATKQEVFVMLVANVKEDANTLSLETNSALTTINVKQV
jgi:hypothetical protein